MTDAEAVREILDGRKDLFALLVERYKDLVFSVIRSTLCYESQEAEDLAQEVFLKAYRALPQFRGEAAFATWLYRITLNHLKDHCRRRRPLTIPLDQATEMIHAPAAEIPETAALAEETRLQFQDCLAAMPEIYRQALYLHHYHGLTAAEIGGRLDLPVKTVETRLYRAKKILRDKLAAKEVPA